MQLPEEPVQQTQKWESISLSVGGKIRFPFGRPELSNVKRWMLESHQTEMKVNDERLIDIEYVGLTEEGYEVRVLQTFKLNRDGSLGELLQHRVRRSMMQTMGAEGGMYYDGTP